jgi:microcystin-dependent protein
VDPFIAEVRVFGFNFAPKGWAMCNGQLLSISQNTALFSLLGTTYGGNGKTNFALPNIQGSSVLSPGQGQGLSLYDLGEIGGAATVSLLPAEMPAHNHTMRADTADPADTNVPSPNASYAQSTGGTLFQTASNAQMDATALARAGGDQPHNNMQPYLVLNYCIALQGVFPPRS